MFVIGVVIGVTGIVTKELKKFVEIIPGKLLIETLQEIAVL